ncbi:MAG TPA: hypothetical protein GX715_05675 [Armatimonadetes bacterium]|jgi:uncharacterized protein YaaQ|nr:hypothetical protein [Armatimonadota bacterium]
MKLVTAVIHDRDKNRMFDVLVAAGFPFTKIASTGGFLREGNVTLLLGVEDERLEELLSLIQENCKAREQYVNILPPDTRPIGTFLPQPVKVEVGGAIVFVVDVERFERF